MRANYKTTITNDHGHERGTTEDFTSKTIVLPQGATVDCSSYDARGMHKALESAKDIIEQTGATDSPAPVKGDGKYTTIKTYGAGTIIQDSTAPQTRLFLLDANSTDPRKCFRVFTSAVSSAAIVDVLPVVGDQLTGNAFEPNPDAYQTFPAFMNGNDIFVPSTEDINTNFDLTEANQVSVRTASMRFSSDVQTSEEMSGTYEVATVLTPMRGAVIDTTGTDNPTGQNQYNLPGLKAQAGAVNKFPVASDFEVTAVGNGISKVQGAVKTGLNLGISGTKLSQIVGGEKLTVQGRVFYGDDDPESKAVPAGGSYFQPSQLCYNAMSEGKTTFYNKPVEYHMNVIAGHTNMQPGEAEIGVRLVSLWLKIDHTTGGLVRTWVVSYHVVNCGTGVMSDSMHGVHNPPDDTSVFFRWYPEINYAIDPSASYTTFESFSFEQELRLVYEDDPLTLVIAKGVNHDMQLDVTLVSDVAWGPYDNLGRAGLRAGTSERNWLLIRQALRTSLGSELSYTICKGQFYLMSANTDFDDRIKDLFEHSPAYFESAMYSQSRIGDYFKRLWSNAKRTWQKVKHSKVAQALENLGRKELQKVATKVLHAAPFGVHDDDDSHFEAAVVQHQGGQEGVPSDEEYLSQLYQKRAASADEAKYGCSDLGSVPQTYDCGDIEDKMLGTKSDTRDANHPVNRLVCSQMCGKTKAPSTPGEIEQASGPVSCSDFKKVVYSKSVTAGDIVNFCDQKQKGSPEGKGATAKEVARRFGINLKGANAAIRELIKNGTMKVDKARALIPAAPIKDLTVQEVASELQKGPATALQLKDALSRDKHTVNQVLYKGSWGKDGAPVVESDGGQPPVWRILERPKRAQSTEPVSPEAPESESPGSADLPAQLKGPFECADNGDDDDNEDFGAEWQSFIRSTHDPAAVPEPEPEPMTPSEAQEVLKAHGEGQEVTSEIGKALRAPENPPVEYEKQKARIMGELGEIITTPRDMLIPNTGLLAGAINTLSNYARNTRVLTNHGPTTPNAVAHMIAAVVGETTNILTVLGSKVPVQDTTYKAYKEVDKSERGDEAEEKQLTIFIDKRLKEADGRRAADILYRLQDNYAPYKMPVVKSKYRWYISYTRQIQNDEGIIGGSSGTLAMAAAFMGYPCAIPMTGDFDPDTLEVKSVGKVPIKIAPFVYSDRRGDAKAENDKLIGNYPGIVIPKSNMDALRFVGDMEMAGAYIKRNSTRLGVRIPGAYNNVFAIRHLSDLLPVNINALMLKEAQLADSTKRGHLQALDFQMMTKLQEVGGELLNSYIKSAGSGEYPQKERAAESRGKLVLEARQRLNDLESTSTADPTLSEIRKQLLAVSHTEKRATVELKSPDLYEELVTLWQFSKYYGTWSKEDRKAHQQEETDGGMKVADRIEELAPRSEYKWKQEAMDVTTLVDAANQPSTTFNKAFMKAIEADNKDARMHVKSARGKKVRTTKPEQVLAVLCQQGLILPASKVNVDGKETGELAESVEISFTMGKQEIDVEARLPKISGSPKEGFAQKKSTKMSEEEAAAIKDGKATQDFIERTKVATKQFIEGPMYEAFKKYQQAQDEPSKSNLSKRDDKNTFIIAMDPKSTKSNYKTVRDMVMTSMTKEVREMFGFGPDVTAIPNIVRKAIMQDLQEMATALMIRVRAQKVKARTQPEGGGGAAAAGK